MRTGLLNGMTPYIAVSIVACSLFVVLPFEYQGTAFLLEPLVGPGKLWLVPCMLVVVPASGGLGFGFQGRKGILTVLAHSRN